ncbi:MAG: hypothetical protein HC890_06035 [Chloroflexaceae bacterium]|nr:hypothetical protein [Chloroflexaceae bacterium]
MQSMGANILLKIHRDFMTPDLTAETFMPHVNSEFVANSGENPQVLTLNEVAVNHCDPRLEQFSLFFRGTPASVLPQGNYLLKHAELGAIELFVTPIIALPHWPGDLVYYEAVFSRLRQQSS